MSAASINHQVLLRTLFEAGGGGLWKKLIEELPELDIYIAGGCVRDQLLGEKPNPKDIDIFVGGSGVEKALNDLASIGCLDYGPFGSPRWHPHPIGPFYYDVIPIDRFFNGLWRCEHITDVLNQFDFTANAVALDLRTGEFFDPQNGKRDILRKTMRAVRFDYPDEPITPQISLTRPEVVWFRILHYAAELDLTIEPVTLDWLRVNHRYEKDAFRFAGLFFPLHPQWMQALK
jgi:hypothetical protein